VIPDNPATATGVTNATAAAVAHELGLGPGGRKRTPTAIAARPPATATQSVQLGVALLFSYRYGFWVQATVGERRLFEYASIPLILLTLGVVEVVSARLERRSAIASATVALAVGLVAVAATHPVGIADKESTPSDPYLAAAVTTPCDSRLLVDRGRTRGSFQALTGRISITEGLEPFLRPPRS
jgi:hypothetical protein